MKNKTQTLKSILALSIILLIFFKAYPVDAIASEHQRQISLDKELGLSRGISIRAWRMGDKNYLPPEINIPEVLKHILPIHTFTGRGNEDTGQAATIQMLLKYRKIYKEQWAINKELNAITKISPIEAMQIYLNNTLFGYPYPIDDQAHGYRQYKVQSSKDKNQFIANLHANIENGYPLIFEVNNTDLYPNAKQGTRFVLGIGFEPNIRDEELYHAGDIDSVFFIDPNLDAQDLTWGGLKKMQIDDLMNAIKNTPESTYLD